MTPMKKRLTNPNYVAIGKRIRESRINAGLTQENLAELASCSESTICRLENGTCMTSVQTLIDISDILNTSISSFLVDFAPEENQDLIRTPRIQNILAQMAQLDESQRSTLYAIIESYLNSVKKA